MSVTIRPARVADAPALGSVHVRAWREAYRGGLMPQAFLDRLSVDDRVATWRIALEVTPPAPAPAPQSLASPALAPGDERVARLVAVPEPQEEPIGFIVVGPERDGSGASGEVAALNVDPDHWGQGVGRSLLRAGVDHLRAQGFVDATLWAHPDNRRARRFYERAGWTAEGAEHRAEVMGTEVPAVRYRRVF